MSTMDTKFFEFIVLLSKIGGFFGENRGIFFISLRI